MLQCKYILHLILLRIAIEHEPVSTRAEIIESLKAGGMRNRNIEQVTVGRSGVRVSGKLYHVNLAESCGVIGTIEHNEDGISIQYSACDVSAVRNELMDHGEARHQMWLSPVFRDMVYEL